MSGPSQVLYIDTDSIIVNDEGMAQIVEENLEVIDATALGALKNEYPLDGK